MKITNKVAGLILAIVLTPLCYSYSQTEDFDYGRVENGVYKNTYFNFMIRIPSNWVVQSKEQTDKLSETGKKLLAGDDENMKAALKATEVNTANLLAVFQYEMGSAVQYNPNFAVVVESLKMAPGVKNGSDYLYQAKRIIEQGQFKYDHLSEKFEKEVINGTEFYKMDAYLKYMGLEIKQIYYAAIVKGFAFNVIISYVTDEQKKTLLGSVNSMTFKK